MNIDQTMKVCSNRCVTLHGVSLRLKKILHRHTPRVLSEVVESKNETEDLVKGENVNRR